MKKITCVFLFIFCIFLIIGCTKIETEIIKNNLSEVRYNIFLAKNDEFTVTFMSGKREIDYEINGYNTKLIDFGILTLIVNDKKIKKQDIICTLKINNKMYNVDFEQNPYDMSFVSDIKQIVSNFDKLNANLTINKKIYKMELENINSNWNITWEEALKIAISSNKKNISKLIDGKEFCGEAYVKILYDDEISNDFYYYVNFVNRNGNNYAVMIEINSGEILAKRENNFSLIKH